MDPISAALVLAVAGGAGGAVGDQAWRGLVALVRRPAHGMLSQTSDTRPPGAAQVEQLARRPDDGSAAEGLAEALTARAALDSGFRAALVAWRSEAEHAYPACRPGGVRNIVSGGTFHGTVVQAGGSVYLAEDNPPRE